MALNFPNSPTPDQTYTLGTRTWTFDGTAWNLTSNKIGLTGYTGSAGTGSGSITISTIAPVAPSHGDLWWNSEEGQLKIYYDDGDTTQWVDASTGTIGDTGYTGSAGAGGGGSKSLTILAPSSSEDITIFYTTETLTISKVKAVLTGSDTPSVTYSIKSGANRDTVSETHVDGATVTSTTSGTEPTVADSSISANVWVWLLITTTGGTVDSFSVTLEF